MTSKYLETFQSLCTATVMGWRWVIPAGESRLWVFLPISVAQWLQVGSLKSVMAGGIVILQMGKWYKSGLLLHPTPPPWVLFMASPPLPGCRIHTPDQGTLLNRILLNLHSELPVAATAYSASTVRWCICQPRNGGMVVLHHRVFEMHCLRSSSACSSIPTEVCMITKWKSPQVWKPATPGFKPSKIVRIQGSVGEGWQILPGQRSYTWNRWRCV